MSSIRLSPVKAGIYRMSPQKKYILRSASTKTKEDCILGKKKSNSCVPKHTEIKNMDMSYHIKYASPMKKNHDPEDVFDLIKKPQGIIAKNRRRRSADRRKREKNFRQKNKSCSAKS